MYEKPKTLVTGANGFVGTAVCASLGVRARASGRRLTGVAADEVTVGDLDGKTDWRDALVGCDRVVHLAAKVHVKADGAEAEYRRINLEGSVNLARQAKAAGVRRMVFMSTAKVHGEGGDVQPYRESDALMPLGAYAASKAAAETELMVLNDPTFEICILRPPLVFGPGAGGNFARLLHLVSTGLPLPFATVRNQRSMISLGNLVSAVHTALDHPGAAGKAYLVADEQDLSLPELLILMCNALKRPLRLFAVPPAFLAGVARAAGQADAFEKLAGNFRIDHQAIMDDTGWRPLLTSQSAMAAVAQWYRRAR